MLVTVFTPTYNRGYILPKLYESLRKQSCFDFEWIVVDDGSTDGTEELFRSWLLNSPFSIKYIKQINQGKHIAINEGLQEAKGDLFFIVDSDDFLCNNAVERILFHYKFIKDDDRFCGICGLRVHPDGTRIGGERDFGILNCSSLDFRFKMHYKGDMAEVLKTNVFRNYLFPSVEGEKFCPEMLVFNRIAKHYIFRYFYEKIYVCEYHDDGLTASIVKVRMNSPKISVLYYSELFDTCIPLLQKIKASINYWRFFFCMSNYENFARINIKGTIFLPIGYVFHLKDKFINKIF